MIRRRFRSTLKLAAAIVFIAGVFWAVRALAIQFGIHLANDWQRHVPLTAAAAPGKDDRIIVFAPHSDDETLACGGLLALAARNGARVRVVLITNGDGFRLAVGRAYKTVRVTPVMCVRFAYRRQRETLNALASLGVKANQVTFLGYPDRGIASLWGEFWSRDRLYVSHATGWDRSPYNNSFTRDAPYCGESLMRNIESVIKREKPTQIYVPHPCDNHSDHYATYCFVAAALEQLESEGFGEAKECKVYTYLVHRGDWPCPKGDYPNESLAPPYALARVDTKWRSLGLPPDVAERKREAIKRYRSQTGIERGFMMSFARRNEIFGILPERRIARVEPGAIAIDGDKADWHGIPPVALDPVGDYVVADMAKGGDVRAIYLCSDGKRLYLRLDCAGSLARSVVYNVYVKNVDARGAAKMTEVAIKPGHYCTPRHTPYAWRGNSLEIALPLDRSSFDGDVFVQVKTRLMKLTVDNTGWRALALRVKN